MHRRLEASLLLLSLSSTALLAHHAQTRPEQGRPALSSEERERLLGIGKKLFVERCAKCHDERGDKPLASGLPLNERDLAKEQIARAVSGRFRDKSDEEKRAVVLYIQSFMKRK